MCQITYSNLNNPLLNRFMVYFLGTIGSERHKDGCGIMCPDNDIWKTKFAARNIVNLGEVLHDTILDSTPIPFHIRMATYGIEVTDENAHPFVGKHYLLMHNGTLIPKDGIEKDKKKDSDSENFLKALDKATDDNKKATFENVFNSVIDLFYGKFAFVIRNKDTGADFIVRGKTADLFISFLTVNKKKVGYVINTSSVTMQDAFKIFVNAASLVTGDEYVFSAPLLLGEETIFLAGKDNIKIVGKTKETTPPVVVKQSAVVPYHNRSSNVDIKDKSEVEDVIKLSQKVYEYLVNHSLSLLDYQIIVSSVAGISLLELTKEDLGMFTEFLIPKITASKSLRKKVASALNGKTFPHELYKEFDLEFPWPVNRQETIIQAIESLNKQAVG